MKITIDEVEKFLNSEVDISGLSESELKNLQNAVAFIDAFGEYINQKGGVLYERKNLVY